MDAALTSVVPASDPLPPAFLAGVMDLAIESRRVVWVLSLAAEEGGPPYTGVLLRVDLKTGGSTVVASGFPIGVGFEEDEYPAERSVAVARGRVFVTGRDGILEIDRDDGSVAVLAPGAYAGLDAEPGGASLLSAESLYPDPFLTPPFEFTRIDLATDAVTPLGELYNGGYLSFFDVAPNGDRFLFSRSGFVFDGLLELWQSTGTTLLWGGEQYQANVRGIASGLDGSLLVAGVGGAGPPDPEENPYALVELERWQPVEYPSHVVLAQLDADFAVAAIDVAPEFLPACSDWLDNDGDGKIDWNGASGTLPDPQCNGDPNQTAESTASCGLGAEVALAFAVLGRASRRFRQPRG